MAPLLTALVLGPLPAHAEFCSNWRMGEGVGSSVGDCMAQAQDASRDRADDARKRGVADQQRSREAGIVADKLDQDKSQAASQYRNPAMSPAQKAQFAQQSYQLRTPYREKYIELSRYVEQNTSRSLPQLPRSNQQLMSYDTSPLRELQQEQNAQAEKLFQQARQAYAAMGNFQQLGGVARGRERAMHSMPNIASVSADRSGKANGSGLGGAPGGGAEQRGGNGKTVTIAGGIGNGESTISRSSDTRLPGAPARKAAGEEKKGAVAGVKPKAGPGEPDPSDKAFAGMEEARKMFESKLGDLAKARAVEPKAKSAVESFLDEVHQPAAGRAPASVAAAGEAAPDEGRMVSGSPGVVPISLAAPEQLQGGDSLFSIVSRQYRKRQKELGHEPAVTARLGD